MNKTNYSQTKIVVTSKTAIIGDFMRKIIHRAETRGRSCNNWLKSFHTFSCDEYYDAERINFGALRVLNDNCIAPGKGFSIHPHKNMEIVTILLKGELQHGDTKKQQTIGYNDIQVISAGTGIFHSEINNSKTDAVEFLQLWIMPRERNVHPISQSANLQSLEKENSINLIISPDQSAPLSLYQDAWISTCTINKGESIKYQLHHPYNGVYIFIIEGIIKIDDIELNSRDGIGIYEANFFDINILENSRILLIEVPMQH